MTARQAKSVIDSMKYPVVLLLQTESGETIGVGCVSVHEAYSEAQLFGIEEPTIMVKQFGNN